jgi:hypothetical protein
MSLDPWKPVIIIQVIVSVWRIHGVSVFGL